MLSASLTSQSLWLSHLAHVLRMSSRARFSLALRHTGQIALKGKFFASLTKVRSYRFTSYASWPSRSRSDASSRSTPSSPCRSCLGIFCRPGPKRGFEPISCAQDLLMPTSSCSLGCVPCTSAENSLHTNMDSRLRFRTPLSRRPRIPTIDATVGYASYSASNGEHSSSAGGRRPCNPTPERNLPGNLGGHCASELVQTR